AEDAVVFAGRFPSWQNADPEALATVGTAVAALWREIAAESPTPWKRQMAKQAAVLALALVGGSQAYLGPRTLRPRCLHESPTTTGPQAPFMRGRMLRRGVAPQQPRRCR
ncbi:hypothetical protein ACWGK9_40335, partial [Streptomyces rubiginosohelvolus]